ncbi:MAG: hypothetical protein EOP24_31730 [Hyphomicrobiales bacterium]|nr:MAG: hypothetical protein EOP24_31730 [Hyphomicrobiales bacterium]
MVDLIIELMHRASVFVDRWEAEAELFRYIAGWYNASRSIFHAGPQGRARNRPPLWVDRVNDVPTVVFSGGHLPGSGSPH